MFSYCLNEIGVQEYFLDSENKYLTESNKSPSGGAESTKWGKGTYLCQLEFRDSN